MQMKIKMNIKSADGTPIPDAIGSTINVVPRGERPQGFNQNIGYQF
jgi:hypothetical protein